MACPWFLPRQPIPKTGTGPSPRTPLGELWSGICRAPGQRDEAASDACNTGYARSRCPHFPADTPNDAVRFNVAYEDGDLIRLQYIYEKQWWPAEHGSLDYSRSSHAIAAATGSDLLREQAAAFAASWVRKTTEER
jgi:hypothetical protein